MNLFAFFALSVTALLVCIWRLIALLPGKRVSKRRDADAKCHLAVFLGSGGHTSEALQMVSALDFTRYSPRLYIVSEGDALSAQKAVALETSKTRGTSQDYKILVIPRARRVHQSLLSTPPTAAYSLLFCIWHIVSKPVFGDKFAEALILNGPGTCFTLCGAVYLARFLGIASPRVIYIESFARTRSLSLSGKLLQNLVDRFVVQWPRAIGNGGRGECHGWLI